MNNKTQTATAAPNNVRGQKIARRIMLAICWVNGITAPLCGILMIISPDGELMMMQSLLIEMQSWPLAEVFFQDLTWPGIALLLVNGVSNLICLGFWIAKKRVYTVLGIFCGVLLIIWCVWEMLFIPNGVTVFYLLVGIVQVLAALYCTVKR